MPLVPEPRLSRLEPGVHGGIDYAELGKLGIDPGNITDFSVCTNPYGPPPGVRRALKETDVSSYPDSHSGRLRRVLAERHGIRERNVLVAGGSTDLIRLAAAAYIGPGDRVLIPKPSYGDYEVACRLAGAAIINRPVAKGKNLRVENGQIAACVRRYRPRALFLCNPNNPTGRYLERDEVEEILAELPETLVVLDEAYVAFVESAWESVKLIKNRNLLIIRSMTKDYALAGLRLGYAMSHERIIRALEKVQPPWSVNAFAQAAGLAAIESDGRTARCRRKLAEIKQYLAEELASLGLETVPSAANYFMVRVDSGAKWRSKLLARGILVRDCASFGLPQYIRLGVRTLPECRKLVETIKENRLAGR